MVLFVIKSIGSLKMTGVSINLDALLNEESRVKEFSKVKERKEVDLPDVLSLLMREKLTGKAPPKETEGLINAWSPWLKKHIGSNLEKLISLTEDQNKFATQVSILIESLDILDNQIENTTSEQNTIDEDNDEEDHINDDSEENSSNSLFSNPEPIDLQNLQEYHEFDFDPFRLSKTIGLQRFVAPEE